MPVLVLDDAQQVQALTHPVRLVILAALRTERSAAEVARRIGVGRQKVGYHLKELEKVGLVRQTGERRKGAFVEQLFEATAHAVVVSPRLALTPDQVQALRDQASLEQLVSMGEMLVAQATLLLDRASHAPEPIPSATVSADVRFADEAAREAFMGEYAAALRPLLLKYGAAEGSPFRLVTAIYPNSEET